MGGHVTYCDPDQYPVGFGTPLENARARFPTIRRDLTSFDAILAAEHLSAGHQYTPSELVAINEDYKRMQAIVLGSSGEGGHRFSVLVPEGSAGTWRLSGTVSASGAVHISSRKVATFPNCPSAWRPASASQPLRAWSQCRASALV